MLSVEHIKESLNDPSLSDEDIKKITNELYEFVDIVLEFYAHQKNEADTECIGNFLSRSTKEIEEIQ